MSYSAMRWAMRVPVGKSSARLVLVALADCVNTEAGDMLAWPSRAHLSRATDLDVKTVDCGIRVLEAQGLIVDTGERMGSTGRVPIYRLNVSEIGDITPGPQQAEIPPKTDVNTPKNGSIEAAPNTPVFPGNASVFPGKYTQISRQIHPKTGDGTRNGTRNGTKKEPGRVSAAVAEIEGVSDALLADWLAVRKDKRAGPLTATAVKGLVREAAKAGISTAAAVQFCCEAGWQGFNAGWYEERISKGRGTTTGKHAGFSGKNYREGVDSDGSFH